MCIWSCTTEPCGPSANVALPCVCSGTVDPTQRQSYTTDKKKKQRERGSERKEERINQARRKTKATGQGGPKCHLASTWGEKKGGEKKKGSLEFTRGKFSFFSWTAECLIMGLDLTSAPLGMWNRGLVVMGGRVWGMMWVGR